MIKPIVYYQTDSRWKSVDYSAPGEKTNIGKAGCGPACMAMVIASLVDKSVTPITTAKWSLNHGYKACNSGTYYSYFRPQGEVYGIDIYRVNTVNIYKSTSATAQNTRNAIINALNSGKWIIACMGRGTWTSSGHYVLAYGIQNGKVLINDPNSSKAVRTAGNKATWLNELKYAWVVDPRGDDEVIDSTKMIVDNKGVTVTRILKDGTNFIKLRDIEDVLKLGEVDYDSKNACPVITSKKQEPIEVLIDGKTVELNRILVDGSNYIKLRDFDDKLKLCKVGYDEGTKTPTISKL